jgi:hypothetical protein
MLPESCLKQQFSRETPQLNKIIQKRFEKPGKKRLKTKNEKFS